MLSVYHMTAFTIGFVMDLLFGDPYWLPHPIRWIGRLIGWLDRKLLGETDGAVRNEAGREEKGKVACGVRASSGTLFCGSSPVCGVPDPSGGGGCYRECHDLPNACHKMLEDGEHESVQAAFRA